MEVLARKRLVRCPVGGTAVFSTGCPCCITSGLGLGDLVFLTSPCVAQVSGSAQLGASSSGSCAGAAKTWARPRLCAQALLRAELLSLLGCES